MAPPTLKLGSKVGEHGSYDFFKSFRYMKTGKWRQVTLGNFFFVKVEKDGPISLGELQLVWTGRQKEVLTSVRLYYLPEQTPDGRQSQHGADELLATDKIVLYAKDLIKWVIYEGVDWTIGLEIRKSTNQNCRCHDTSGLACNVQILPYSVYCRLRSTIEQLKLASLNLGDLIQHPQIQAMVGFTKLETNCYILFSRAIFNCPQLDSHPYRCEYLAPKLKGRPRKKIKSMKPKQASEIKVENPEEPSTSKAAPKPKNKLNAILNSRDLFLKLIQKYLKDGGGPVPKVPSIDGRKVDLYVLFKSVHQIGGFGEVGRKRMWKNLYDKMGGNPNNTSAATRIKRIYERFLLSYEHHLKSVYKEEYKTIRVTNAKHKQTIVKTEPKCYEPLENNSEQVAEQPTEQRDDSPSPRRPTTRQQSCTIRFGRTIQLDELPKQDSRVKIDTVSAKSTWTVPEATTSKTQTPENMRKLTTDENPIKQEKLDELETRPVMEREQKPDMHIATADTEIPTIPAKQEEKKKEKKEPRPAHCLSKALMPLNVLGPCHPNKLVAAQMSPWKLRFNVQYDNPDSIGKESLKKLKTIKLEPGENVIDMTQETLDKLEKLEQERKRRAAAKAEEERKRRAAEAAELERKRKAAECFRESPDGALDLSVKRPKMEPIVKREPPFVYPQDAPINCSLKPEKRMQVKPPHSAPIAGHSQPICTVNDTLLSSTTAAGPHRSTHSPYGPLPSQRTNYDQRSINDTPPIIRKPRQELPLIAHKRDHRDEQQLPQTSREHNLLAPRRHEPQISSRKELTTVNKHQSHLSSRSQQTMMSPHARQTMPSANTHQAMPLPHSQQKMQSRNQPQNIPTINRPNELLSPRRQHDLSYAHKPSMSSPTILGASDMQRNLSPHRHTGSPSSNRVQKQPTSAHHQQSSTLINRHNSSPAHHHSPTMHHSGPTALQSSPTARQSNSIHHSNTISHHNTSAAYLSTKEHSNSSAHYSSTVRSAPVLSSTQSHSAPNPLSSTQRQTVRPKPESNPQPHSFQQVAQQSSGRSITQPSPCRSTQSAQHVYPPPLHQTHSQHKQTLPSNKSIPATITSSQLKPAHSHPPNTQPAQFYNSGNSANLPAPPRLMNMSHLASRGHLNEKR